MYILLFIFHYKRDFCMFFHVNDSIYVQCVCIICNNVKLYREIFLQILTDRF